MLDFWASWCTKIPWTPILQLQWDTGDAGHLNGTLGQLLTLPKGDHKLMKARVGNQEKQPLPPPTQLKHKRKGDVQRPQPWPSCSCYQIDTHLDYMIVLSCFFSLWDMVLVYLLLPFAAKLAGGIYTKAAGVEAELHVLVVLISGIIQQYIKSNRSRAVLLLRLTRLPKHRFVLFNELIEVTQWPSLIAIDVGTAIKWKSSPWICFGYWQCLDAFVSCFNTKEYLLRIS